MRLNYISKFFKSQSDIKRYGTNVDVFYWINQIDFWFFCNLFILTRNNQHRKFLQDIPHHFFQLFSPAVCIYSLCFLVSKIKFIMTHPHLCSDFQTYENRPIERFSQTGFSWLFRINLRFKNTYTSIRFLTRQKCFFIFHFMNIVSRCART